MGSDQAAEEDRRRVYPRGPSSPHTVSPSTFVADGSELLKQCIVVESVNAYPAEPLAFRVEPVPDL